MQGEWLVKALKGKGNIIAFNGMKGTAISALRFEGAKSVFDQYPDIKIVQEVYADWDYAKAKRAMEDLLAAYPKIDGVWSQGGAMSEAVVETYLEKGMDPPPVTGEDGNGFLKIWKKVKDSGKYPNFDSIATSMPTWCSAKAMDVALDALTGKTVQKYNLIPIPTITAGHPGQVREAGSSQQLLVQLAASCGHREADLHPVDSFPNAVGGGSESPHFLYGARDGRQLLPRPPGDAGHRQVLPRYSRR